MEINDLRDWLREADKIGEVVRVDGADWNLEIGCASWLNLRTKERHALLFDNINGYPSGYRVLTCSNSNKNLLALTLNLPQAESDLELSQTLQREFPRWEAGIEGSPTEVVETGPVMENVLSGDHVNLLKFPAPKYNQLDGGRYIGTGHVVITRDPDEGWVNLGTYRMMVHDKKTAGLMVVSGRHVEKHYKKYHNRRQPCPVAVSVGHHPVMLFAGGLGLLPRAEYPFAAAIMGKPVRVINEKVTGLPIPADAEIVFTGWIPPDKERMEGPFGEWPGYYGGGERPMPIIEVERIYHRNEPIILGSPRGIPPHDGSYFRSMVDSAMLHTELKNAGITGIRACWMDTVAQHQLLIISLKQEYAGHAKRAGLVAAHSRAAATGGRYVILVDEDIDPSNPDEVRWAMCSRSEPAQDIDIIRGTRSSALNAALRKPAKVFLSSIAIIDACKPFEWIDEFPQSAQVNPEVMRRVKEKWGSLLSLD